MRGRLETVERWSCYLMLRGMLQGVRTVPIASSAAPLITLSYRFAKITKIVASEQSIGKSLVSPS